MSQDLQKCGVPNWNININKIYHFETNSGHESRHKQRIQKTYHKSIIHIIIQWIWFISHKPIIQPLLTLNNSKIWISKKLQRKKVRQSVLRKTDYTAFKFTCFFNDHMDICDTKCSPGKDSKDHPIMLRSMLWLTNLIMAYAVSVYK